MIHCAYLESFYFKISLSPHVFICSFLHLSHSFSLLFALFGHFASIFLTHTTLFLFHVFNPPYRLSPSFGPFQHSPRFFLPSSPVLSFSRLPFSGWRLSLASRVRPSPPPPLPPAIFQPPQARGRLPVTRLCRVPPNRRTHGMIWGREGPQDLPPQRLPDRAALTRPVRPSPPPGTTGPHRGDPPFPHRRRRRRRAPPRVAGVTEERRLSERQASPLWNRFLGIGGFFLLFFSQSLLHPRWRKASSPIPKEGAAFTLHQRWDSPLLSGDKTAPPAPWGTASPAVPPFGAGGLLLHNITKQDRRGITVTCYVVLGRKRKERESSVTSANTISSTFFFLTMLWFVSDLTCFPITRCKAGAEGIHLPASSCKNKPRNTRQMKLPTIASSA